MNVKLLTLGSAALLSLSTPALAGTITVTGSDPTDCTLADAVAMANAPDATPSLFCVRDDDTPAVEDVLDTIVFAADVPDEVAAGDTLRLATPMTIDGGGRIVLMAVSRQRIFDVAVAADETVTLTGLTLAGNPAVVVSGGVRVSSGTLAVTRSTFDSNTAHYGGALHVEADASVLVSDSTFIGNEARVPPGTLCNPDGFFLGAASTYVALAGSTITNTGGTILTGDLGTSPGSAVTGFPPGIVNGAAHSADATAAVAQLALTDAYNDAAGRTACSITVAGDLGGQTFAPGLYTSTSSLAIGGADLVLDAQGDADARWLFQMASTLTVSSGRKVLLVNGANAANVYWQVGSSATLGTNSSMQGTILAFTSITVTTGASVVGRVLARNGAVTFDTNSIVSPESLETGSAEAGGAAPGGHGLAEGGAVDCFGTCSFDRVLFAGNIATATGLLQDTQGGAINAQDATVIVRNSTFVDNESLAGLSLSPDATFARGGAIASTRGTLDVTFATFHSNVSISDPLDLTATTVGGALYTASESDNDYTLYAAVISGNIAANGTDCSNAGGALLVEQSLFDNAISQNDCEATALTNTAGLVDLLSLGDNGGPTQTVRFGADSPALNSVPTGLACALAGGVDQRGYPRATGAGCDRGALELEDLGLVMTGPSSYLIPGGATAAQTATLSWRVFTAVPVAAVSLVLTAPVGVTLTARDDTGLALPSCVVAGVVTTCPLGALAPGQRLGTLDVVFPATQTTDIAWLGAITYGFADADALNDVANGVLAILECGDTLTTSPETCDDGGALGGCNATCSGCELGFGGLDCLTCLGLDDGNVCTTDVCDPATGAVHTANQVGCDDNDPCTSADVCAAGACAGVATNVDDNNPCTNDSCDPLTGAAVHTNNTQACDDGNACTTGDICAAGACGGVATNVDDNNPCTDDSCAAATGAAVHTNNTQACDDNNACTTNDVCGAGACGGVATNVDDNNPCTDDSCTAATGAVVHTNNTGACSDGDACTTGDICAAGTCSGGAALAVDDNNPCTDDSCDPTTGAKHENNTQACDDNSVCTTGDVCSAGTCSGTTVDIDDGDLCTDDRCDATQGVLHTANNDCATGLVEGGGGGCNSGSTTTGLTTLAAALGLALLRRRSRGTLSQQA